MVGSTLARPHAASAEGLCENVKKKAISPTALPAHGEPFKGGSLGRQCFRPCKLLHDLNS